MECGAVHGLSPRTEDTRTRYGVSKVTSFESTEWGIGISGLSHHPACSNAPEGPQTQIKIAGSHDGQSRAFNELRGDQVPPPHPPAQPLSRNGSAGEQEGRSIQQLKEPVSGDGQPSGVTPKVSQSCPLPLPTPGMP